eukprot:6736846-Pyramimonas_sp.AAC.1
MHPLNCSAVIRARLRRLLLQDLRACRLSDNPWITVNLANALRCERRAARARQPPELREGWVIYASDGASRSEGGARGSASSCGCGRYQAGTRRVVAAYGRFLAAATNHAAEYA